MRGVNAAQIVATPGSFRRWRHQHAARRTADVELVARDDAWAFRALDVPGVA